MQDVQTHPLWRAEDLGRPIPDSPHAVSVCLPRWEDVVGYEEKDARVLDAMKAGYPRFVYHRACRELFALGEQRLSSDGQARCLAFPSRGAAERCAAFVRAEGGCAEVLPLGVEQVHVVCVPPEHFETAGMYWRHAGEGVSSRQADRCLRGEALTDDASAIKQRLRERIAGFAGASPDDVWLFPTGMASLDMMRRVVQAIRPDARSVQLGFPYVDTLKILQKLGPGVHFYPCASEQDLAEIEQSLAREPIAGVFTEMPSNPLLSTCDLPRLAVAARRQAVPLIVDDTLATWSNIDVRPCADVVCTSLTKFFSGVGDVTGGAVVLNEQSSRYAQLREHLTALYEDLLDPADAEVLERNSVDFTQRMASINHNAERLAEFLQAHPKVATVYYPKFQCRHHYDALRRPEGGYGGILSVLLRDAERNAARFYDRLPLCKGPNLGTNYTLACPYTIIAHYQELDFVESCGVSRYLVRMSVGTEDAEHLIDAVGGALDAL